MSTREERLKKEGYRDVPGRSYAVKTNTRKTEFDSHEAAMAHHDSQHTSSGDLIDNSISSMVSGGGK